MQRTCLFPGTFDPITRGHLDVIARAEKLFDRLIVAVGRNPEKSELFPIAERITIIESLLAEHKSVSVEAYEGLFLVAAGDSVSEVLVSRETRIDQPVNTEDFAAAIETAESQSRFVVVADGRDR